MNCLYEWGSSDETSSTFIAIPKVALHCVDVHQVWIDIASNFLPFLVRACPIAHVVFGLAGSNAGIVLHARS